MNKIKIFFKKLKWVLFGNTSKQNKAIKQSYKPVKKFKPNKSYASTKGTKKA